uniref:CD6 molecule n=1 Tax=Podarcis muralis TaxID=64176 RepID=A0A670HUU6_PODMU
VWAFFALLFYYLSIHPTIHPSISLFSHCVTSDPTLLCIFPAETRKLRLVDGRSNCSGRVEVEYNGTWGTICDDNWDLADAGVVCRQLHCGWALQAPIASHFQKGTGPIYLDEVKCLGNESFLWDCPSERNHDCGHKEDHKSGISPAVVSLLILFLSLTPITSAEHQEWRLSEGLDACAGRVEVYYRGTWNTVCDGNWYQDEADVLCHSLNCSEKASVPRVPFNHTLMGKMYYDCSGTENSLASCSWLYNNSNVCAAQFGAAGVICNGNCPNCGSQTPICVQRPFAGKPYRMKCLFSVADSANPCASTTAPILLNHIMQVSATGTRNNYQQVPTNLPKEEGMGTTAVLPTPLSEDSDSDYEHYDFSSKPPVQLSTFYSEHLTTARHTLLSCQKLPSFFGPIRLFKHFLIHHYCSLVPLGPPAISLTPSLHSPQDFPTANFKSRLSAGFLLRDAS